MINTESLTNGVKQLCDSQGIEGHILLYNGDDGKIKVVGTIDPAFLMKSLGPSIFSYFTGGGRK